MTEQQEYEFPFPLYEAFHRLAIEERAKNRKTWHDGKERKA